MWHEGTAQRGANEITSCLFKFIMSVSDTVETLILYSDTEQISYIACYIFMLQ